LSRKLALILQALLAVSPVVAYATGLTGPKSRILELLYLSSTVAMYLANRRGNEILSSVVLTLALTSLLKALLHTPRPELEALGPGFPSGHTALATSYWALVYYTSPSPVNLALGLVGVALMATERLLEHAHTLADVVGGIAVGLTPIPVIIAARSYKQERRAALLSAIALPLSAIAIAEGYTLAYLVLGASIASITLSEKREARITITSIAFTVTSSLAILSLAAITPKQLLVVVGAVGIAAPPLIASRAFKTLQEYGEREDS